MSRVGQADAIRRLHVQYETTRALAESASLAEAAPRILKALGETLGFDHGAVWTVDRSGTSIRCLDTWHPRSVDLPEFALLDRSGRPATLSALRGRPWIADFIFTRCAGVCPAMTARMAALAKRLEGVPVRFVSFSVDPVYDTPEVLAIDPNGSGNVTETHVKWVETKYAPKTPSMIFDNGLLYMLTDSGIVACREGKSGTLLWESERILRDCSASLLLGEGKLYALDEIGKCAILAAGREYKLLATSELPDEKTLASIAVDEGTIYLRGEKTLYCIREKP